MAKLLTPEKRRRLFRFADEAIGAVEPTAEQRVVSLVWRLESQVNNGGFSQYFASWDGADALDAVEALKEIGAVKMASIVRRAIMAMGHDVGWSNMESRQAILTNNCVKADLRTLDAEFMAYPDGDSEELLLAFIGMNASRAS